MCSNKFIWIRADALKAIDAALTSGIDWTSTVFAFVHLCKHQMYKIITK